MKYSIFDPSSPHRHATELNSLLTQQNDPNPILMLYTDGGPDHHVNFLSVQLSLIAVFLTRDLDCLIAVRTPPFNSWKNPAKRVMSELNLALQAVGLMRTKMSKEFEHTIDGCKNMKAICTAAAVHPEVRGALKDSLEPVILLVCSLFQRLKLKDEPFSIFTSASTSEMDTLASYLAQIEPGIDPVSCTKADLVRFPSLKQFLDHCCRIRRYSFSILKCGSSDCQVCRLPRLSRDVFDTLQHLPYPIRDGTIFKPFCDVYGTATTEEDRPSLSSLAEKRSHGMPFSPSGQFARNVARTLTCTECGKPRVLYSSRKLQWRDKCDLENEVGDLMYTCGMDLHDCIPADLSPNTVSGHLFNRVFVPLNVRRTTQIKPLTSHLSALRTFAATVVAI